MVGQKIVARQVIVPMQSSAHSTQDRTRMLTSALCKSVPLRLSAFTSASQAVAAQHHAPMHQSEAITRRTVGLQINASSSNAPMPRKARFIRAHTAMMMRAQCLSVPVHPSDFTCQQAVHVILQNVRTQKLGSITLRMEAQKIPAAQRSVPTQKLESFMSISRVTQATALSRLAAQHLWGSTCHRREDVDYPNALPQNMDTTTLRMGMRITAVL